MNINKTLKKRGDRYGDFADNAELTRALMECVFEAKGGDKLSAVHEEALHMMMHKVSRMVCGDPWYADNAHDIAGYATLLEGVINEHNNYKEIEDA